MMLLDRDGVINEDSVHYIKSPDEWHPIPGSLKAIAQLNKAGYKVAVVTNQSGIARGYYDKATLDRIHEKMQKALQHYGGHIDAIFICPHHPTADCLCRKPNPTLLLKALAQYAVAPRDAIFVGDKWSDIAAAQAAHCQPVLVKTGQGAATLKNHATLCQSVPVYNNLAHYVEDLFAYE